MPVQDQEGWPITPVQLRVTAHHWQTRAAAYARNSFLAAYSTFIDNTLVAVLQWLRLDELFTKLTPWLEDSLAFLTRNWHYTADGQRIPYSLVNNAASDFSIPPQYNAQKLLHNNTLKGYDAASDYNPQTSHFLGLCMKVVYEKELVIKDVVESWWGLQFHSYWETGSDSFVIESETGNRTFVPRTRAAVFSSPDAIVLTFRGSEPTNLINLRSAGTISMMECKGMGSVHSGFYGALFNGDEEQGRLFDDLVGSIRSADEGKAKAIYLTGHSLGAALSLLFAAELHSRHSELAERVAGVYAYASPRVGNAAFAAAFNKAFCNPDRVYRVAHGADIIPYLPPKMLEYADVGPEIFITSTGKVLFNQKDIRKWHQIEGWGFLPLYLYKLGSGLLGGQENPMRTLYRLLLLVTFPGLNDHFPGDYEDKLRRALSDADNKIEE
ncbi:g5658 [Coccomyxa viridis]|uniref:G5658 protein n=1 Tax=Coccomyxa viridis TaxID=1274662 RepID=A0ABP1FVN3_9CHLO